MTGKIIVDGNTDPAGNTNNLFIPTNKFVTLVSPGLSSGSLIGVNTQATPSVTNPVRITSTNAVTDDLQYISSDKPEYTVSYNTGGYLELRRISVVTTPPIANVLTYNGTAQTLVTAGEAQNGTMYYTIGTDNITAPDNGWSTNIPVGMDAGTYYVWYKSVGDEGYEDSIPVCVEAVISRAPIPPETGDPSRLVLWLITSILSMFVILLIHRRKAKD